MVDLNQNDERDRNPNQPDASTDDPSPPPPPPPNLDGGTDPARKSISPLAKIWLGLAGFGMVCFIVWCVYAMSVLGGGFAGGTAGMGLFFVYVPVLIISLIALIGNGIAFGLTPSAEKHIPIIGLGLSIIPLLPLLFVASQLMAS